MTSLSVTGVKSAVETKATPIKRADALSYLFSSPPLRVKKKVVAGNAAPSRTPSRLPKSRLGAKLAVGASNSIPVESENRNPQTPLKGSRTASSTPSSTTPFKIATPLRVRDFAAREAEKSRLASIQAQKKYMATRTNHLAPTASSNAKYSGKSPPTTPTAPSPMKFLPASAFDTSPVARVDSVFSTPAKKVLGEISSVSSSFSASIAPMHLSLDAMPSDPLPDSALTPVRVGKPVASNDIRSMSTSMVLAESAALLPPPHSSPVDLLKAVASPPKPNLADVEEQLRCSHPAPHGTSNPLSRTLEATATPGTTPVKASNPKTTSPPSTCNAALFASPSPPLADSFASAKSSFSPARPNAPPQLSPTILPNLSMDDIVATSPSTSPTSSLSDEDFTALLTQARQELAQKRANKEITARAEIASQVLASAGLQHDPVPAIDANFKAEVRAVTEMFDSVLNAIDEEDDDEIVFNLNKAKTQ